MTDEGQASQGRRMWEEESWKATRFSIICNTSLRDTQSQSLLNLSPLVYTSSFSLICNPISPTALLSFSPSPSTLGNGENGKSYHMGCLVSEQELWLLEHFLSSAKYEGWASLQLQKGNSALFSLPHCSHLAPRPQWESIRTELQLSVFGARTAWLNFLLIKSRREQINPTMSCSVSWG